MLTGQRIAFLGAGAMGSALMRGLLQSRRVTPAQLLAADPDGTRREAVRTELGVTVTEDNAEAVRQANLIVLAVKPQVVVPVLHELRNILQPSQLLISIAAGVTLATLESAAQVPLPVVRVMPNTPALVGCGASAYCLGTHATPHHGEQVRALLSAVGSVVEVEEKLMNAVTGLSGSGPAYVYLIIEALADGGVRCGLPRTTALQLAAQTVLGAAQMVLQTGEHPGVLKDRVASPGGTTIVGLQMLERRGMRGALLDAVLAAAQRAEELTAEPEAQD
ncbi:MAG TPA: pyrroline-5-carboxylate reductase [Armatimonadetes bacterium]|nr:pyrroline-5-carboxylate reductase [Armatimonadota bacterium]